LEICFYENCDLGDTSLANKPKKCLKMILFYYKIGLVKLPLIAKLQMRLSLNYDFVFTNLLKNEAELFFSVSGW